MTNDSHTTINYFETIYSMSENAWGQKISDLALEAAALLKTSNLDRTPHVLDIGCGDGRDSLFFASQGWKVTAVDVSGEALRTLAKKAEEQGVADLITIVCEDIRNFSRNEKYDLVFSNYTLHFLESKERAELLTRLMHCTSENGYHAILAMRDLNEEVVGSVADYRYLSTGELAEIYTGWNQMDVYNGYYPDEHVGCPLHYHSVGVIIAQKPETISKISFTKKRSFWRNVLLSIGVAAISVILCTFGYSTFENSIANVWPASIFQVVSAAALGGWGVLATIIAGIATNAINITTLYAVLAFIPANFIQSFIPAYYYRRALRKGGWNKSALRFGPFLLYGVLIPNFIGAICGATAVHFFGDTPFFPILQKWLIANIPIAIILGWPLFRFLIPTLVEEGWTIKGWWK